MKTFKLPLAIFLILGTVYYYLDRQLFYYGKNDLPMHNSLPLKIKPEYRHVFEGGIVLWDEHGFAHIGKGVRYFGNDFVINEIIKYGFNDEKLVAQIKDKKNQTYYVETKKNENPQSKQEIEVKTWSESEQPSFDNYQWIQLKDNEEQIKKLERWHGYVSLMLFLLIALILYKAIRNNQT